MSVSSVVEVFAPETKPVDANSPTGVSAWAECQRKWGFRYLAKMYAPATASTALGTDTHDQLEHFLRDGRDINYTRNSGEIAAALLHFAPKPKTPGMILEREFYFRSKRTGFVYTGKKDVELPPGIPQPQLQALTDPAPWFDGSAPIVLDWKTTQSINDYAKTDSDLEIDPQSNMYALDSMARFDARAADLAWLYSQTRGAKRSQAARIRLGDRHVLKVFDGIEREAEGMARAREMAKGQSDLLAVVRSLPPTLSACKNFGGCPYRTQCQLSTADKLRSRMGLIDDLRNRVSAESTPAPPTTAPPVDTSNTERPTHFGDPTTAPAPTEIPKWATEGSKDDPINPPERNLPPAPLPEEKKEAAPPAEQEKKTRKPRAPKAPPPDPKGADALAHTGGDVAASNGAEVASASGTVTTISTSLDAKAVVESVKEQLEQTIAATARPGFTLYVDCMPIGKAARMLDRFIAKAQERMAVDGPRDAAGQAVPDYRLVDFGKGTPAFVAFVLEQIDGSEDLVLDTRTPEGAVLLAPLAAKAAFMVRGLR